MYNWVDVAIKAKTMPPGHVLHEQAKKLISEEYGACNQIEKTWIKRFKKIKLYKIDFTEEQAKDYCNKICNIIGEKKYIKKVILNSKDVSPVSGGHYDRLTKEIHFKNGFWFNTLIHELAHHCSYRGSAHGDDYCLTLNIIWSIVYEDLMKKKCHEDWI